MEDHTSLSDDSFVEISFPTLKPDSSDSYYSSDSSDSYDEESTLVELVTRALTCLGPYVTFRRVDDDLYIRDMNRGLGYERYYCSIKNNEWSN